VPLAVAVFAVTMHEVGCRTDDEGPTLPSARICLVDCTVMGTRRRAAVAERPRDATVGARPAVDGGDDAAGVRATRLPWLPQPVSSVGIAAPTANAVMSRFITVGLLYLPIGWG
jgi:hypothetical protein